MRILRGLYVTIVCILLAPFAMLWMIGSTIWLYTMYKRIEIEFDLKALLTDVSEGYKLGFYQIIRFVKYGLKGCSIY